MERRGYFVESFAPRPGPEVGQGRVGTLATGTTSAILVPDKRGRRRLVVCNRGTVDVYLAKGSIAIQNAGYYLRAHTGVFWDEPDPTGWIYTGPWAAISNGTGSLSWSEE